MRHWRQTAAGGLQREACGFPAGTWDLPLPLSTVLGFQITCWKGSLWLMAEGVVLKLWFVRNCAGCGAEDHPVELRFSPEASPGRWHAQLKEAVLEGGWSARGVVSLSRASQPRGDVFVCSITPTRQVKMWEQTTGEPWCTVPGCHHPQLEFVTCCVWEWEGEGTDCAVSQPHLWLMEAGQERKKKEDISGLQDNNNQPKGISVTTQRLFLYQCRSHSSLLETVVPHLWHVSSVYLLCGIFLPSPQPLSAAGASQAKAGTLGWGPHPISVQSRGRGVEGRCSCARIFK